MDQSSSRAANYFAPAISEATSAKHSGQTAKGKRPEKDTSVRGIVSNRYETLVYAMRATPFSLSLFDFSARFLLFPVFRPREFTREEKRIRVESHVSPIFVILRTVLFPYTTKGEAKANSR